MHRKTAGLTLAIFFLGTVRAALAGSVSGVVAQERQRRGYLSDVQCRLFAGTLFSRQRLDGRLGGPPSGTPTAAFNWNGAARFGFLTAAGPF